MNKEENLRRIAIQGIEGSFHDIASRKYFGDKKITIITHDTFEELFKSIIQETADIGVVAIENTIGGTIQPNYSMLKESNLKIIGEIYLRIEQNLIALKGQKIKDIKEVQSHFMAINQCRKYLQKYPYIKLIEAEDTALSIKKIKQQNLSNIAGIGHSKNGDIYDMEIIARGIETNKKNFTRFWVIGEHSYHNPKDINKASICFILLHNIGKLSSILSIITNYKINLTKIESLPIIGQEWSYQFYIDMVFEKYQDYLDLLQAIKPLTEEIQILGEYLEGEKYLNANKK